MVPAVRLFTKSRRHCGELSEITPSGTMDGPKTICLLSSPRTVLGDHIGLSAFPTNQGNATGDPWSP